MIVKLAVEAHAAVHNAVKHFVVVKTYFIQSRLEFCKRFVGGYNAFSEHAEYRFNDRSLARVYDTAPKRAVLDRAERRIRHRHIKVAVHADGHDLAPVKRNGLHGVGECKVLLRVVSAVVRAVHQVCSDVLVVLVRDLVARVQVVHRYRHVVLIRGEQQINVSVVELHAVVVASQDFQIANDLGAVRIIPYGDGILLLAV